MERKGKKIIDIPNKDNNKSNDDELKYMLWQAELNKELFSFWKTLTNQK